MSGIPKICECMSHNPQTIDAAQSVTSALRVMEDLSIRHLPVLRGAQVVGIVSERDLKVVEAISQDSDTVVKVGDLCSLDVYTVGPETPLDQVLDHMEQRRIGSAVVVDAGYVVGVFTMVDACRGYKDLLRSSELRRSSSAQFCG